MKKRHYLYIAFFLFGGIALSIWVGRPSKESFFSSLSTEIVGVFITVLLIETFLQYREQRNWRNVNSKILGGIIQLCFSLINKINVCFNVPRDLLNEENLNNADRKTQNEEIIRFLEEELTDDLILDRINNTPDQSIFEFIQKIEIVLNDLNTTLSIFNERLDPPILDPILNIRRTLSTTINYVQFATTNPNDMARFDRNINADLSGRIAALRNYILQILTELNDRIDYSELRE